MLYVRVHLLQAFNSSWLANFETKNHLVKPRCIHTKIDLEKGDVICPYLGIMNEGKIPPSEIDSKPNNYILEFR